MEGVDVIYYKDKVYVPYVLQTCIISWYHDYLRHPSHTHMEETIKGIFYWPKMRNQIERYVKTCHDCQLSKKQHKKYGHLPPKQAETIPWQQVNVDLIGPYTIKTPNKVHTLQCMTMIDPATSWFEIAHMKTASSAKTQWSFDAM